MNSKSGKTINRLMDRAMKKYDEMVDFYVDLLLEDGYPPFTEPVPPRQRFESLKALKRSGAPQFWGNPEAQREFAQLERRFGREPVSLTANQEHLQREINAEAQSSTEL